MRRTEVQLYRPLLTTARAAGWALYRLSDASGDKKPFDLGGVAADGRAVGLEVKVYRQPLRFASAYPWRDFELQQLAWLRRYAELGAYALVALYCTEGVNADTLYVYRLRPDDVDRPTFGELPTPWCFGRVRDWESGDTWRSSWHALLRQT